MGGRGGWWGRKLWRGRGLEKGEMSICVNKVAQKHSINRNRDSFYFILFFSISEEQNRKKNLYLFVQVSKQILTFSEV